MSGSTPREASQLLFRRLSLPSQSVSNLLVVINGVEELTRVDTTALSILAVVY